MKNLFFVFITLLFVFSSNIYAESSNKKESVLLEKANSSSTWVVTVRGELIEFYIDDHHIYIQCSSNPDEICYVILIPENQQYNSNGVRTVRLNDNENTEKEVIGPAVETSNGNSTTYDFELND